MVISGPEAYLTQNIGRSAIVEDEGYVPTDNWRSRVSRRSGALALNQQELDAQLRRMSGKLAGARRAAALRQQGLPKGDARRGYVRAGDVHYKKRLFTQTMPDKLALLRGLAHNVSYQQWRDDTMARITAAWPQLEGPVRQLSGPRTLNTSMASSALKDTHSIAADDLLESCNEFTALPRLVWGSEEHELVESTASNEYAPCKAWFRLHWGALAFLYP